jgi:lipoic acid synthetase
LGAAFFINLHKEIYFMNDQKNERKPDWLKIKLPQSANYSKVKKIVQLNQLHTICTSGNCPNIGECWDAGTATFMILGEICTRSCKFCSVITGKPLPIDIEEPKRIADSVQLMKLKHCVITSVDRDDLPDGGAEIWANTILEIKKINPDTTIEVLIPDFNGDFSLVKKVLDAKPTIISHNLETVRRLTPDIRSKAKYDRSLEVIKYISENGGKAKSGIMLGLGETEEEVIETMKDLINAGCQIMTIGQYLRPKKENFSVQRYVTPEEFKKYEKLGIEMGFRFIESKPLVRSSFHAEKHIH